MSLKQYSNQTCCVYVAYCFIHHRIRVINRNGREEQRPGFRWTRRRKRTIAMFPSLQLSAGSLSSQVWPTRFKVPIEVTPLAFQLKLTCEACELVKRSYWLASPFWFCPQRSSRLHRRRGRRKMDSSPEASAISLDRNLGSSMMTQILGDELEFGTNRV